MNKARLLANILENGVTPENRQLLEILATREQQKSQRTAKRRHLVNKAFRDEIWSILTTECGRPLTATDIQFLIKDFVPRKVTNQKVARHLNVMCNLEPYVVQRVAVANKVYFVAGDEVPSYLIAGREKTDKEVWW